MIIGVTGTLGAGKGSVVKYLVEKRGYSYLSVTGFMKSVAQTRGINIDRMTYHNIANEYRAQGATALQKAVIEDGEQRGVTENFVIEAQHTPEEVRFIQGIGGKVFAVDAEIAIRYGRIIKRGGDKDSTTFEEFKEHEELELSPKDGSSNNLIEALKSADFSIENNGTLEELHQQIELVLERL
jgi:dephospho-CoA kinase